MGSVREAGEKGAESGIKKVAGSGRKRGNEMIAIFCNPEKKRGGSQQIQEGNRD